MRLNSMWRSCLVLHLAALAGVVTGTNECLELSGYRCQAATEDTSMNFEGCDLTDSDLGDLATCFDNVGRATIAEIWLDGNGLTQIDANLFTGLEILNRLRVERNALTTLQPGVFNGLNALERMSLEGNMISSLPENAFNGLESLEQLDLSSNSLTSLPAGLFGTSSGLGSLKTLYLNINSITSLAAGDFEGLESLTTLILSFNQLEELPFGLFRGLDSLMVLAVDYNMISDISTGIFDGLNDLGILYLNDNELETLPASLLAGLGKLDSINMMRNEDLQCAPSLAGTSVTASRMVVPNDVGDTCECPAPGVDEICIFPCYPGPHGYICTARRTLAPSLVPAPEPTAAPTPEPTEGTGARINAVDGTGGESGAKARAVPSTTGWIACAAAGLVAMFARVMAADE